MKPDPERLRYAVENREPMRDAIRRLDLREIKRIVDGGRKVNFTIGRYYRLCVFGAPPVEPRQGQVEHADQAIGKLIGMDPVDTVEASGVVDVRGTYKGRDATQGLRPHVFRAPNGQDIVLTDMDVLAWEKA